MSADLDAAMDMVRKSRRLLESHERRDRVHIDIERFRDLLDAAEALWRAAALAPGGTPLPCGHPETAVVTGGEGTAYCGECAAGGTPACPCGGEFVDGSCPDCGRPNGCTFPECHCDPQVGCRGGAAGTPSEPQEEQRRIADAVWLAEGALLGTESRRAIWEDDDYLCAILATLTGDGDRARTAAIASYARRDNIGAGEGSRPSSCMCGHAARWHSHHGTGDCEHDVDCDCEAFEPLTEGEGK